MIIRSIRVDRKQIGYVKWLLESHDGMATPTTREGTTDILDLLVAPDFAVDFDVFLAALHDEMDVEIVDLPETPPLRG